ncbi:hypothetical protein N7456_010998 [Penicillium angulare]|uniref:FAD/NAD(P)-binding domain-containing protein n=1 Tax=Penicillium angulare TaxID=116970 RepID=A0A9W9EST8_9EURO|nr:hypothetical protein N7456_010998 [Penicillium angulare]
MERVVIVGAGLYGLIAAKTYLQVVGTHEEGQLTESAIPSCFSKTNYTANSPGCHLLVLDAGSDIGGTWAEDRLYPNLLSQNSYGLYEFSDMSLADTVPDEDNDGDSQFIPGWKINRYLHAWVTKWGLSKHIKLNSKVMRISRLETQEWNLTVQILGDNGNRIITSIICDKLILATGLTSIPNLPNIPTTQNPNRNQKHIIHATEIGTWSRTHLGYRPLPKPSKPTHKQLEEDSDPPDSPGSKIRSVVVYGGAKSSFDLVHFFATLHRKDPTLHLKFTPSDPVQVHWIIRDNGLGPSWMVPPTSSLPNGQVVASDKAASIRFLHHLSPCSYELPKRVYFRPWKSGEDSWFARLFHGNPLGRWAIRRFWRSIDRELEEFAQYESDEKMRKLRPSKSIISCGASVGIANQQNLWEAIRSPNVEIYRSSIQSIMEPKQQGENLLTHNPGTSLSMSNGEQIEDIDLIIHATGYQPIVPINFQPPSLRPQLGLSAILSPEDAHNEPQQQSLLHIPSDQVSQNQYNYWNSIDLNLRPGIKSRLLSSGCIPIEEETPSSKDTSIPYRLFRRMVAPDLLAKGDRSFVVLGVVLTSTIAVVAEIQALWATAFLTGGLDKDSDTAKGNISGQPESIDLKAFPKEDMEHSISEDVVLGSLTGSGLEVDAINYNDLLLRDLGLNPYRLGGGLLKELIGVYEPRVYAGIVEEWMIRREFLELSSLS